MTPPFAGDPDISPPDPNKFLRAEAARRTREINSHGPTQVHKPERTIPATQMHDDLTAQLNAMRNWQEMDNYFKEYLKQPVSMGHEPPLPLEPIKPMSKAPFLPQPEEIQEAHDRSKHTAWGNYKIWLRGHLRRK